MNVDSTREKHWLSGISNMIMVFGVLLDFYFITLVFYWTAVGPYTLDSAVFNLWNSQW